MIPIARPVMGTEERAAVLEVLDSGRLVSGPRVERFEQECARAFGAAHAVALNTGTAALQAALAAHGVGPGDEVVVPGFSFFATASAVLAAGATPVFADIDPGTYCLDPAAAAAAVTERTAAILAVHLYGHPAALRDLRSLCGGRGLLLLEDAAQAHGAALDGDPVGAQGTVCFSFHAGKNMTTGEGGLVLTGDADVADRLRLLRNQGMRAPGSHEVLGGNLRMTEIAAAIGLVQLSRLAEGNARRADHARTYSGELRGVGLPSVEAGATHAWNQYTIRAPGRRDDLVAALLRSGIEARVYYPRPMHREQALADRHAQVHLPVAEAAADQVLSIPVHPQLTAQDLGCVVAAVNAGC